MSFWNSLRIGASGLNAQRLRLDIIANNIANAETTRTASGGPYQRRDVVFADAAKNAFIPPFVQARQRTAGNPQTGQGGVQVSKIITDDAQGPVVYDPTHPDADDEGFVEYPNVNLVVEMTNMLSATRSYEANLTVIESAKNMAKQALEIGR